MYFLIYNSDGDTHVKPVNPTILAEDLAKGEYGDCGEEKFLKVMPRNIDTNTWPCDAYLLIKGEIVTPTPVSVVQTYKIP